MANSSIQPTPDQWSEIQPILNSLWDFSSDDLSEFTQEVNEIFTCYAESRPSRAGKAIFRLGQINLLVIAVANQYDLLADMVAIANKAIEEPVKKGGCHA